MTNEHLFLIQMIMLNNFLNTSAMFARDYEKSAGGLTEKMGYLIEKNIEYYKTLADSMEDDRKPEWEPLEACFRRIL